MEKATVDRSISPEEMGNMMSGMNGMDGHLPPINNDTNIIDAENVVEVPAVEDTKDDFRIISATMLNNNIRKTDNNGTKLNIGLVIFLCKAESGKLLLLSYNYHLSSKKEIEYFKSLPTYLDNEEDFISKKICNVVLNNNLDHYAIEGSFEIPADFDNIDNPEVSVSVVDLKTKINYTIKMCTEIFAAIKYIDKYFTDQLSNSHDLALANSIASKEDLKATNITTVKNIEEIVALAPAVVPKKGIKKLLSKIKGEEVTTTVGVVIKFTDKKDNIYYLLAPFDTGVEFDNSKFKGNTIKSIQDNFYGDTDQFVSTLLISEANINLNAGENIGNKNYMIIRGKTKNLETRLFMFDQYTKERLIKLINEY